MALVDYGNSDSSEYEDDDNDNNSAILSNNKNLDEDKSKIYGEGSNIENDKIKNDEEEESLFNELPKPTSGKITIVEEDDEFLHKKALPITSMKPKPKIMIPSLNDFKDVENTIPSSKPKAANGKKSGLLNILPQPKNGLASTTKSFIPNVLTQKPQSSNVKKKEPPPKPKNAIKSASSLIEYSDDSDEEIQNDFFSINKPVEIMPDDVQLDAEENLKDITQSHTGKMPRSIESYFKKEDESTNVVPQESEERSIEPSHNNITQESSSNELVLDEEAILKLCGARGKRKREEIQIVDINQQEVLNDAREMLLKGLMEDTSQRQSASKKRGNEPTSQQRRKHQITYLAHQAKANEVELQNQWASNRMTKRKTQSKYGF